MQIIGILGGMSAASTALYYAELNALVQARLGGLHSANLLLRSVDFAPVAALQAKGDWDTAAALLCHEARALQAGGAQVLILATNTMHKVADQIVQAVDMPFVHIADATGAAIVQAGFRRPGLMATAFTMEQAFYTGRLRAMGLQPIVPLAQDRAEVHRVIYEELCRGVVRDESRQQFEAIAARLVAQGADCLILGCTEVGMLLGPDNVGVAVFDTVKIHCAAALDCAMAMGPQV